MTEPNSNIYLALGYHSGAIMLILIIIYTTMKKSFLKSSRKGPVVFTDPCPESPVSKVVDILQAVAVVAAVIVSVVKR